MPPLPLKEIPARITPPPPRWQAYLLVGDRRLSLGADALLQQHREDGVRARRVGVHERRPRRAAQRPSLQQHRHLLRNPGSPTPARPARPDQPIKPEQQAHDDTAKQENLSISIGIGIGIIGPTKTHPDKAKPAIQMHVGLATRRGQGYRDRSIVPVSPEPRSRAGRSTQEVDSKNEGFTATYVHLDSERETTLLCCTRRPGT